MRLKTHKCFCFLSIFTSFLTFLTTCSPVQSALPCSFLFPRTPSPLMTHHYHPPTCEANPCPHITPGSFMLQRKGNQKRKRKKKKETRGGTNSFPRINSHLSFISPFSAPAPPLHLPVVDTGGGFWFLPAVEGSR